MEQNEGPMQAPNVVPAEPEGGIVNVFSPFLMPPVIRCLLKQVQTTDLKGLRRTSSLWNQMTLQEMEQRAMKGEYLQLGFDWNLYLKTRRVRSFGRRTNRFRKSFWKFFHQTKTRPSLFRSFYLNFPDAPLVLNRPKFISFFENYKPSIVNLAVHRGIEFTENAKNLLRGFVRWMAPTLQELAISDASDGLVLPPIPAQQVFDGIVFPNLKKLVIGHRSFLPNNRLNLIFTTLFGQENCELPKLTSLQIFDDVSEHLDDLFGINTVDPIRWYTLKSLLIDFRVRFMHDHFNMNKFADGLYFLGQSGMTLNYLQLNFNVLEGDFNHESSGKMLQFLLGQADSLEHLSLNIAIRIHSADADPAFLPKIYLPVCPKVKWLDISGDYFRKILGNEVHFELYSLISLPINFPRLNHLSLSSNSRTTMKLFQKDVNPAEKPHLGIFEYKYTHNIWGHGAPWTGGNYDLLFNTFSSVGSIKI